MWGCDNIFGSHCPQSDSPHQDLAERGQDGLTGMPLAHLFAAVSGWRKRRRHLQRENGVSKKYQCLECLVIKHIYP